MLEHRSFIVPGLISKEVQRSLNYQIVLFLAGWLTFHSVASIPVMCAAVLTAVNFATKVFLEVLTWSRSRLKPWLLVEVNYLTLVMFFYLSCSCRRVSSSGLAIYWTESSHKTRLIIIFTHYWRFTHETPYQIFFSIFFGPDVAKWHAAQINLNRRGNYHGHYRQRIPFRTWSCW